MIFRLSNRILMLCIVLLGAILADQNQVFAQTDPSDPTIGQEVNQRVERIYAKGLKYLAQTQKKDGSWPSPSGFGSDTAGVAAICTMAFLSQGEDPNFGQYAVYIRRGLRRIILAQNPRTGLFKGNSYDYGFALLCLAEAYGAVDDELLWAGQNVKTKRTIGEALELGVKAGLLSKNRKYFRHRAWYSTGSSPGEGETDTSVAGSILVGMLAARNAGVDVPDLTIDSAVKYFEYMTNKNGTVGYMRSPASAYGNSMARSSIATLVLRMAKRTDSKAYQSAKKHIIDNIERDYNSHIFYGRYYMAQALFQSDIEAWRKWNQQLIAKTTNLQRKDGSIGSTPYGKCYTTGMSLLALALNYRFLPVYER